MYGTIRGNGDDAVTAPEIGHRVLPVELDRIAKVDPQSPYFSRPRNPIDLSSGFEDITYRCITNAVNRAAHWLEKTLGKPNGFETIAYLAPPDIRNVLLVFAVSKVGYKASSLHS